MALAPSAEPHRGLCHIRAAAAAVIMTIAAMPTEAVMLHSMQPVQFIVRQQLESLCKCPECESRFIYGEGVMSLSHYLDVETDEVRQGLMCFCSTTCLLSWEHPTMLGLMH